MFTELEQYELKDGSLIIGSSVDAGDFSAFLRLLTHPLQTDFFDLWQSKCNAGKIPARGDFPATEFARFAQWLYVMHYEPELKTDIIRFVGNAITEILEYDGTDTRPEELLLESGYDTELLGSVSL